MRTKKILAVLMCAVILLTAFVSCKRELTPLEMQTRAALKLLDTPYVLTMTMEYTCDDEMMQSIFDTMSGIETKINVDGKNFSMNMELMDEEVKYIFYDKVMYIDMMGMKIKSQLTDEQLEEQFDGLTGSSMNDIDLDVFTSYDAVKNDDGSVTITAKGLEDSAADVLDGALGDLDQQEGISIEIDKENIEFICVIDKDCNYKTIYMSMSINMIVDGYGSVTVDVNIDTSYDFENAEKVTAPADADQYTDMSYEDIMG